MTTIPGYFYNQRMRGYPVEVLSEGGPPPISNGSGDAIISVAFGQATIVEDDAFSVIVTRTGNADLGCSVIYTITDPSSLMTNGLQATVTFGAGEVEKEIDLDTNNVGLSADSSLTVTISDPVGCAISTTASTDNLAVQKRPSGSITPEVDVYVSDTSNVTEGNNLTFKLRRNSTSKNCQISWAVTTSDTASDIKSASRTGTALFAGTELEKEISIGTNARAGSQGSRVATLTISTPVNCTIKVGGSTATRTIIDATAQTGVSWGANANSSGLAWFQGVYNDLDGFESLRSFTSPSKTYGTDLVTEFMPSGTWNEMAKNGIPAMNKRSYVARLKNGSIKAHSMSWQFFPWPSTTAAITSAWPSAKSGMTSSFCANPLQPPGFSASASNAVRKQLSMAVWEKASLGWFDDLWRALLLRYKKEFYVYNNLRNIRVIMRPGWEENFSYTKYWGRGKATRNGVTSAAETDAEIAMVRTAKNKWAAIFKDVFGSVNASIPNDFAYPANQMFVHWCPLRKGEQTADIRKFAPEDFDLYGPDFYDHYPTYANDADWNSRLDDRDTSRMLQEGGTSKGEPQGIRAWLDFAKSKNKKFAIGEWGVWSEHYMTATGARPTYEGWDNPVFIRGFLNFMRDNAADIAYESYFNIDHSREDLNLGNGVSTAANLPGVLIKTWSGINSATSLPNPIPRPPPEVNKWSAWQFRQFLKNYTAP